MKKWFAYGAIFFSIYLFFIIVTLPAGFIFSFVKVPNKLDININNVTGTVWQANIEKIKYNDLVIEQVLLRTSFWSLLTLDPSFDIQFGDALSKGPEGKLTLSGLLSNVAIEQLNMNISANDIAQQLALPIPLTATGLVELSLESFILAPLNGKNLCQQVKGRISWPKAKVIALDERVTLGNLSAALSCDKGALAVKITPKNDLGLTFTAYLNQGAKFSGNGYLQPGENFPNALKQVLPFIGNADINGRYRLKL